eukprot:3941050-Rhodomonas_salina.1
MARMEQKLRKRVEEEEEERARGAEEGERRAEELATKVAEVETQGRVYGLQSSVYRLLSRYRTLRMVLRYGYALAIRCPVPTWQASCMFAMRSPVLTYGLPSSAYEGVQYSQRKGYAMCDTEIAYGCSQCKRRARQSMRRT